MTFPITLIVSNGALACKSFALDNAGNLTKTAAAQIYSGRAHIETFASLRDFVDSRALADTQTAYVYGVPANGERSQRIRTKATEGPGISRSKADSRGQTARGLSSSMSMRPDTPLQSRPHIDDSVSAMGSM